MFADLVDTDGTGRSASLMTYEKVSRGVTRPCNVSSKCPKQSPFGTVLRGGGGEDGEGDEAHDEFGGGSERRRRGPGLRGT